MTNAIHEWVVYHPPKSSSFGHHSAPRNPRLAWPKIGEFLDYYSNFELSPRLELTCFGPSIWTDEGLAADRILQARSLFGPEKILRIQISIGLFGQHSLTSPLRLLWTTTNFPNSKWAR